MEHRYNPRVSTDTKVLIYMRCMPIAIGRLRNVSRGGLFIASDCDNIALNQPLEIEIMGVRHGADSHRRCRTMVTHKARDGFGLTVDDGCMESCNLLAELVSRHRDAPLPAVDDLPADSTTLATAKLPVASARAAYRDAPLARRTYRY